MIREFPEENRAELVVPQCPVCQRYMVRNSIAARLGSDNTTRKRGTQTVLDPLTASPNATMFIMSFRCKNPKHPYVVKIPTSELVVLNQYPPKNVKLTDRNGNEL